MAYSIKDPATDRVIRELAAIKRLPILESIRIACENEIRREKEKVPLWRRLQPLLDDVAASRETSLPADKAFFDALSGEPE